MITTFQAVGNLLCSRFPNLAHFSSIEKHKQTIYFRLCPHRATETTEIQDNTFTFENKNGNENKTDLSQPPYLPSEQHNKKPSKTVALIKNVAIDNSDPISKHELYIRK
jgi:hypothetical protein